MIKKMLFEVKHCKIEIVVLSRSAQAAKLKKLKGETPRPQGLDDQCQKGDKSAKLGDGLF